MEETMLKAKDLNQQAVALMSAGNYDMAMQKLDEALEIEPMLIDSYKNYGIINFTIKNYSEAMKFYKKALLIEKNGEIYFLYGNACFMNDEPHRGLENYNLALSAGYDNDEMYFFMGLAYEYLNDDNMALRYFQKACIKNPSKPNYAVRKIHSMLKLNMMNEALEASEKLILNSPELYDGYHLKTIILLELNQNSQAEKAAKYAAEKFPEDAELLYDYARISALNGNLEVAVKLLEDARKLNYYENAKSKFAILEAEVYANNGDIDNAIEKCKECIGYEKNGEINAEARFTLISLLVMKKDYEQVIQYSNSLIDAGKKDSFHFAALYYKPYSLKQLGRNDEADKYYKEAISLYRLATIEIPNAIDAYLYRAMCLKDTAQYDEALDMLQFVEGVNPNIAQIYTIRADIYKLNGKNGLRDEELNKAYKIDSALQKLYQESGE